MGNDQDQTGVDLRAILARDPVTDPRRRRKPAKLSRRRGRTRGQTWSNTVDRAQKENVVEELGQIFARLWRRRGRALRGHHGCRDDGLPPALKQAGGGSVRVAKNKLAKIALKGTPGEKMGDLLTGMTVLAYSEDPVAAAKVVEDFTKVNKKFVVLGGAMGARRSTRPASRPWPPCRRVRSSSLRSWRCIGAPGRPAGRRSARRRRTSRHPHHPRGARGGLTAT